MFYNNLFAPEDDYEDSPITVKASMSVDPTEKQASSQERIPDSCDLEVSSSPKETDKVPLQTSIKTLQVLKDKQESKRSYTLYKGMSVELNRNEDNSIEVTPLKKISSYKEFVGMRYSSQSNKSFSSESN